MYVIKCNQKSLKPAMIRTFSISLTKVKLFFGTPCPRIVESTGGMDARFSSAQPIHEYQFEDEDFARLQKAVKYRKMTIPHSGMPGSHALETVAEKKLDSPIYRRDPITERRGDNISNMSSADAKPFITTATNELSYYTDGKPIPITSRLEIVKPGDAIPHGVWPAFRLMDQDGSFRNPACDGEEYTRITYPQTYVATSKRDLARLREELCLEFPFHTNEITANGLLQDSSFEYPDIQSTNTLWRLYRQTVRLREMDTVLLNAQRQGRVSFYMTCTGEEAIHMGVASALDAHDHIMAQYREQGVIMWRGFTLEQFTNQCFSNDLDLGKGRQMPIHYGSRALNYHTISSPLGTQLPQAVGVACRLKMMGSPNVAVAFFGEGCASTPDFHSALNFAATLQVPCLFFCRNNGYAISTPTNEQYAGDGIVSRAPGYGIAGIRIDGNDFFAVHAAVREARKYALANAAPVLIEGITYRQSHHSTSDDSSAYRNSVEVNEVVEKADPLSRLERFLYLHGWLDDNEKNAVKKAERNAVLHAFQQAEQRPKPNFDKMFDDVYCGLTPQLKQQKTQLVEHMEMYPDYYSEFSH